MDDNLTDEELECLSTDNRTRASPSSTLPKKTRFSRTKKFSNPVHQWFNDEGRNSKCIVCSKILSGRHASALKNHLESAHSAQFQEYKKLEQEKKRASTASEMSRKQRPNPPSSTETSIVDHMRRIAERKTGLKKGSDAYEKAIRSIAIAFVANSLPYQLIEDSSFERMIATVSDGRLIDLPRRQDLSTRIENLTDELKSAVKSAVGNAKYVSLTLDLWSRPGYSSAMMGITCHYFNRKSRQLQRALVACRTISQPHTGENIHDLYNTIREEWNLSETRILRIVTDNGSNVVSAFK